MIDALEARAVSDLLAVVARLVSQYGQRPKWKDDEGSVRTTRLLSTNDTESVVPQEEGGGLAQT